MIVKIMLLPHGMQIIPGVEEKQTEGFAQLNTSMERVAQMVMKDPPELIVLVSPHGYTSEHAYTLYKHNIMEALVFRLEGDSVVHGRAINRFNVHGDVGMVEQLAAALREEQIPVELLTQGFPDYPLQLCWGPGVPLYYLRSLLDGTIPVLVMTIPRKRLTVLEYMKEELHKMASILMNNDLATKKTHLIISADLGHAHDHEGPYGFHETAARLDNEIMHWAQKPDEISLDELLDLNKTGLACGMAGIVMITPLLQEYALVFHDYACPSYFGMGIFVWEKI